MTFKQENEVQSSSTAVQKRVQVTTVSRKPTLEPPGAHVCQGREQLHSEPSGSLCQGRIETLAL